MKYSDDKIKMFVDDLEIFIPNRARQVNKLRGIYRNQSSSLYEKFIYGGIGIYLKEKLLGGIWVYTKHISVIFSDGYKLNDPNKILEGGGKYRRHVKIREDEDIEKKQISYFIEQVIALEHEKGK